MKGMDLSRLAVAPIVIAAAIFSAAAAAQQTAPSPDQAQNKTIPPSAAVPQREIVVSLEDRKLALIENGEILKIYTVAVGKPSTPSPEGAFTILRRVANPTYHHDGKTVLPGPNNPVGTRWMGLSKTGYGIHGTNEPKSIGKAASHGCIRLARPDLEELYPMVAVGDTVRLIGHRDEETARLFGSPEMPAAADAPQPTLTAMTDAAPTAPSLTEPASAAATPAPAPALVSMGTR